MIETRVDIAAIGERDALPYLNGFWNERSNVLAPVPKALRRGVGERSKQYLDVLSKMKWLVIEEWDDWRFEAERRFL